MLFTGLPPGLSDDNHEWVLDFCNFREAWSKTRGAGVVIALPDTGWTHHPELQAPNYRTEPALSKNFYEPIKYASLASGHPDPNSQWSAEDHLRDLSAGHGTGTASTIISPTGHPDGSSPGPTAAFPQNNVRAFVSGAAPEAAVIPLRVTDFVALDDDSCTALSRCIFFCISLRKAMNLDVGVMSLSLGRPRLGVEKNILAALRAARHNGIIVIAAAGQLPGLSWPQDVGNPQFPGSDPNTICVAACDSRHAPLAGAFYGDEVLITAPGVNVWRAHSRREVSSDATFHVNRSEGTSYATALTAAACALWQSHHGRAMLIERYGRSRLLTAFKMCLLTSADSDAVLDEGRGIGVLDADRLLETSLPSRQLVEQADTR